MFLVYLLVLLIYNTLLLGLTRKRPDRKEFILAGLLGTAIWIVIALMSDLLIVDTSIVGNPEIQNPTDLIKAQEKLVFKITIISFFVIHLVAPIVFKRLLFKGKKLRTEPHNESI